MTRLARLQQAIDRHWAARPVAHFEPLFIGSRDYRQFEAWSSELEMLRKELVDLCEGHIVCNHPIGAIIQHPLTGEYHCDLCGKDLKK